jgi:hypothetical protein
MLVRLATEPIFIAGKIENVFAMMLLKSFTSSYYDNPSHEKVFCQRDQIEAFRSTAHTRIMRVEPQELLRNQSIAILSR